MVLRQLTLFSWLHPSPSHLVFAVLSILKELFPWGFPGLLWHPGIHLAEVSLTFPGRILERAPGLTSLFPWYPTTSLKPRGNECFCQIRFWLFTFIPAAEYVGTQKKTSVTSHEPHVRSETRTPGSACSANLRPSSDYQ